MTLRNRAAGFETDVEFVTNKWSNAARKGQTDKQKERIQIMMAAQG